MTWLVYGDLAQPTGGYVYDRIVVEALRARGDDVALVDPRRSDVASTAADVVVGDALCAPELGPAFERTAGAARVLLVHHLTSWELERSDAPALARSEARAVRASDHLVATGRATADRLRQAHAKPVDVVVPGADRLPRLPRELASGERVELLSVGSLVPRKRLPLVLDALEAVGQPDVRLTVVGDAARDPAHARAVTDRVAASPALAAAVRFAGVVADDDLARRMARADALVMASSLEGYGMAAVEALHAGLPVILAREAAEAAGLAGSGGVLVFDAGGLADAFRRFAADARLRAEMGRAARAATLPRWSEATRAFGELLTRVAAVRAPGRARPR